jgi:hypothetical protein
MSEGGKNETLASHWPYPVEKEARIVEMQKLANELFFSGLSSQDKTQRDIKDSMMNNCFGPALDLRIRGMDWGFKLSDVHPQVYMQHSRLDEGFITAEITSKMLPNCIFLQEKRRGIFRKSCWVILSRH